MKLRIGRNYWKLLACVAILFSSVAVTSCSDDDDDKGGGNTITTSGDDSQQIKGKLRIMEENDDYEYTWGSYVSDEVDELEVYAEDSYYSNYSEKIPVSNGEFTYTLPASIEPEYLWNAAETFERKGMTVSNKEANMGSIWFRPLKNDSRSGYISLKSSNFNIEVELVYADSDVKISGTHRDEETYTFNDITYTEVEIYQYDVNLKKGWNTVVTTFTEAINGTTYTQTEKITANNEPANLTWGVRLYSNYSYSAIDESSNESVKSAKAAKAKKFFNKK